ncbi:F-box/FBD/LRR-repeat protein At1g16930-like [Chenopodium quinoa]|uniref:F-box/FBD/LRR-repeat protein At1g16930-like n=1 Tax=Chenopodium quinoa TaxID=63459 RepID=UPI000B7737D3|nr:F-box/FBD/LRR-repeat protein At1g16930-like [Chenopodium quinoa]
MEKLRMGDCKIMKYYSRKRPKRSIEEEEDRLSSLPDAILTDILSRLSIDTAAKTSVLSHHWRRLWTGVTRVDLYVCNQSDSTAKISYILRQLTCRKLRHFGLTLEDLEEGSNPSAICVSELESWFHQVFSRNVENISVNAEYDVPLLLPAFLFNSQSLVTLSILGVLKLPKIKDLCVNLPNLNKLTLDELDNFPLCLENLIKSCSLLEHLDLVFDLDLSSHVVNIIASNLKSLSISNLSMLNNTRKTRVYIDAPKLAKLKIQDWSSIYYFLQNPSILVKACIQLENDGGYDGLELDGEQDYGALSGPRKEYICQMTKFFGGLSSVSKLELKLESWTNILRYFNCLNLPIFSNLTWLQTNCFKDLLISLNYFPNLEHLEVDLWLLDDKMEQRRWCAPDFIPDCLVSKLETIHISTVGIDDDLRLLAYILSNAIVLKKLLVDFSTVDGAYVENERDKAYAVWKECQLCRSLLNLPRSSSTCEVVVSGRLVAASGNAVQGEFLTCQMYLGKYT